VLPFQSSAGQQQALNALLDARPEQMATPQCPPKGMVWSAVCASKLYLCIHWALGLTKDTFTPGKPHFLEGVFFFEKSSMIAEKKWRFI
jgi:hypothetical protein